MSVQPSSSIILGYITVSSILECLWGAAIVEIIETMRTRGALRIFITATPSIMLTLEKNIVTKNFLMTSYCLCSAMELKMLQKGNNFVFRILILLKILKQCSYATRVFLYSTKTTVILSTMTTQSLSLAI